MTDSEKLNVIISRLDSLECDMQGMKSDVQGIKNEMQGMKGDIQGMKSDIQGLKSEMQNVKRDINALKHQTAKSIDELKTMDKLILDEVERVHNILDRHKADKAAHSA